MAVLAGWFRSVRPALVFLAVVTLLHIVLGDPQQIYLTPLLIACPALAAGTASPLGVVVVGALVLVTRQVLAVYDGALAEAADAQIFHTRTLGYLAVIIVSAYLAHRRARNDRKLAAVTSVALTAQQVILHSLPTTITDIRVGLRYVSAADEALIGGDLYEVVATQFGTRILIGDVKGSGLEAVYAASIVLGAFRAVAYDEPDLGAMVSKVETTVYRHLGTDDFVTALFVEVGVHDVTLLHRGHVPPLLITSGREVVSLDAPVPGPPLGLSHLVDTRPRAWRVPFSAGDTLVLYTDGVVEARGPTGFYPLAERVAALVDADLDASAGRLYADLLRHTGRALTDDAILMLVARAG